MSDERFSEMVEKAAKATAMSLADDLDGDWDADPETGGWLKYATPAVLAGFEAIGIEELLAVVEAARDYKASVRSWMHRPKYEHEGAFLLDVTETGKRLAAALGALDAKGTP